MPGDNARHLLWHKMAGIAILPSSKGSLPPRFADEVPPVRAFAWNRLSEALLVL